MWRVCRDCPDLFSMVPPDTIGACLEDERVRQPREIEALVRLSCLKYKVRHAPVHLQSSVTMRYQAQSA